MKIIVVGAGKVGVTLIENFVKEGHDVAVVDIDANTVDFIVNHFDVNGIVGSGLERQVSFELIPSQKRDGKVIERAVKYIADFVYEENGETVVEDTKGMKTREYIIKRTITISIFFQRHKSAISCCLKKLIKAHRIHIHRAYPSYSKCWNILQSKFQ